MRIQLNARGNERRKLADTISVLVGQPVVYKGAPGFEYQIGAFTLNRNAELIWDETGAEALDVPLPALNERGYTVISEGGEPEPSRAEPVIAAAEPAAALTIELPVHEFTDAAIENMRKIAASKAALIKKAVGASDLPIEKTDTVLRFSWFPADAQPDEIDAYSKLVTALCAAANHQKKVTAKERPVENEKFAFRVFLVRLGFVGAGTKSARAILLKNLSGNSAWKNGKPAPVSTRND